MATAILTKNEIQDKELLDLLTSGGIQFKNAKKAIVLNEVISNLEIKSGLSIHDATKIFGEPDVEMNLKTVNN